MNTTDVIEPATATAPSKRATVADLYDVEGKAELIGGRIIEFMANGLRHNLFAANLYRSLCEYAEANRRGVVLTDSIAFAIPELRSGRGTFSPDTSYHFGPLPENEGEFIAGPPTFAVEVRSACDYGPKPERDAADKRRDCLEAGTLVVWDVDPRTETTTVYRREEAAKPTIYHRGEIAEAEPAAPGWRLAVDEIFA